MKLQVSFGMILKMLPFQLQSTQHQLMTFLNTPLGPIWNSATPKVMNRWYKRLPQGCTHVGGAAVSHSHFGTMRPLCLRIHGPPVYYGNGGRLTLQDRSTKNKPWAARGWMQNKTLFVCVCVSGAKPGSPATSQFGSGCRGNSPMKLLCTAGTCESGSLWRG